MVYRLVLTFTRAWRRRPWQALAVVVSISVGMAISVAAFSVLSALVFDEAPGIAERASLLHVRRGFALAPLSGIEAHDIETLVTSEIGTIAAEAARQVVVDTRSGPMSVSASVISPMYFKTLGTRAFIGRTPTQAEIASRSPVAFISHHLWTIGFGSDPKIESRAIRVGPNTFDIVGVAPPDMFGLRFREWGETAAEGPQLWLPALEAPAPASAQWLIGVRPHSVETGRKLQAKIAVLGTRADTEPIRVFAAGLKWSGPLFDVVGVMLLYLSVPLGVLAIGFANVLSLQLADATGRIGELSVRAALGARRSQLAGLLTCEIAPVIAAACGVGWIGALGLLSLAPPIGGTPVSVHGTALLFMCVLAVTLVVGAGTWPALAVSRRASSTWLQGRRDDGVPHRRLRQILVVGQVGCAIALLYTSASIVATLDAGRAIVPDDAAQVLTAEFRLASHRPQERGVFLNSVLRRVEAEPGTTAVGFADFTLFDGAQVFEFGGRSVRVGGGHVTPGWFNAVGATTLMGKTFTDNDATAQVIVVNEAAAAVLAPARSAAGLTVRRPRAVAQGMASATVIGVVRNHVHTSDGRPVPMAFVPLTPHAMSSVVLFARSVDVSSLEPRLRAIFMAADPDTPWHRLATLESAISEAGAPVGGLVRFTVIAGLLALALATVGLHAMLAHDVRRRRHEIGVRLALGASRRSILATVARPASFMLTFGVVIGLIIAVPILGTLRATILGLELASPLTIVIVAVALTATGLAATVSPAMRAAQTTPLASLRSD